MANTYLTRTQSANETDSKKATISAWVKLSAVEGNYAMGIFGSHVSGDYNANGNGQIGFYNGGLYAWWKTGGSTYYKQESTRRFRDTNAWYHVVYRFDTTQGSGDDRIRVYLNGEEVTSWVAVNDPPQNANIEINNGGRIVRVGTYNYLNGTFNYFNGSMSHYHFCDGYSYAPTEFGSTDATTGEWKINTSPSVSYGTNGFTILKDGNTITDQSPNSNNFTVGGGTLTKTEDCPSNVFATLNPLARFPVAPTYSNGNNTTTAGAGGAGSSPFSTIGASSGKYYAELSLGSANGGGISCGIIDITQFNPNFQNDAWFYYPTYGYAYISNNGKKANNNAETNYANSYTNGDRIGVAMDLDNNKLYFAKNGVWQNSGDPTSGATGTGSAFTIADGTYGFAVYGYQQKVWNANFGNGYFGTTAVSSAGTNASNIGIFEYDVPTGYTALSTKGLNL